MRTPSFDEMRRFLEADGWSVRRRTGHEFYEKILHDGQILETRVSWSGRKTMSPGRFMAILSDQLKVTQQQFWEVLLTGTPATRPSPSLEPGPASLPKWLDRSLRRELGLGDDELAQLTEE